MSTKVSLMKMKVVVANYCGTVGKTTVASNVLAPALNYPPMFAVETINETAADLGVETEKLKGNKFGDLFRRLLIEEAAIVDVGASNVEDFLDQMVKFHGSHEEIDFFVVPVTSGAKEMKESIKTIQALAAIGVPAHKIRVLFNRVDTDVTNEFAPVIGFAAASGSCVANPDAAIFENDVFNLLSAKKLTIDKVVRDKTDYRQRIRDAAKGGSQEDVQHLVDMHALKSLAVGADAQVKLVFRALFS